MEAFGYKQELKRALSLKDLVVFGIVFMAPVSSMTLFGIMAVTSQGHNMLSYLLGFLTVLFTAYSYGQMVEAFPIAGSTFSYTQRAISPKLGFLAGWIMLLDYVLIPMLLYVVSALFANALIPEIPFWAWVLIYVIPVTVINICGVEIAAKANFMMTLLMILAIVVFLIASIKYAITGNAAPLFSLRPLYNPADFSITAIAAGASMAVLSYLGFDAITTLSEEANATSKKIGKAIFIACFIQTILYLAVAYFGTLVAPDYTAINNPDTAFFEIAFTVGGSALQTFISIVIMVSGVATALAGQSAASRLLYGMGRDRLIPSAFFAYLHPRHKTPTYSILFMAVIGVVGGLLLSFSTIAEMVTFGGLFGFICVNLSVMFHYYFKNNSGKIIRHVLFPLLGMAVCIYIMISLSSLAKIVGFSWMGIGIAYIVIRSLMSANFKNLLEQNSLTNPEEVEMEAH